MLRELRGIHENVHLAGAGLPRPRDVLLRLAEMGRDAARAGDPCPLACRMEQGDHEEDCPVADAMELFPVDLSGEDRHDQA